MTKVAVLCVPYILYDFHAIFGMQTMLSVQNQKTIHDVDTIAIVNGVRSDPDDMEWIRANFDHVEVNEVNNLSRAWNKGMAKAFSRGAEYVLLINMDLILHSKCIDNLVNAFNDHPEAIIVSAKTWPEQTTLESAELKRTTERAIHFSCFMVDRQLIDKIGPFDEQFGPAYHEDSDMMYRLGIGGHTFLTTDSALFWHVDRVSLKGAMLNNDNAFLDALRVEMDASMERYVVKWGGLPGQEKFKSPYNV